MTDDRDKIGNRPDYHPDGTSMAGTGPGIPDDALGVGEELPTPPSDEEVDRVSRALGAPTAERDTLPLEGE